MKIAGVGTLLAKPEATIMPMQDGLVNGLRMAAFVGFRCSNAKAFLVAIPLKAVWWIPG